MRVSKSQYYNDYFSRNTKNSKLESKGIKQIICLKPKSCQIPSKIIDNDRELTDKKEIANALCSYFANIGDHLASIIPNVDKSPLDYLTIPTTDRVEERNLWMKIDIEVDNYIFKFCQNRSTFQN